MLILQCQWKFKNYIIIIISSYTCIEFINDCMYFVLLSLKEINFKIRRYVTTSEKPKDITSNVKGLSSKVITANPPAGKKLDKIYFKYYRYVSLINFLLVFIIARFYKNECKILIC